MTAILKVDTIQDTAGNNIINESSDTITIGASGDTTNIVGTLQNNGAALVTGVILQVVQGSTTTETSSSSATFADTTLTASITPSATSSKVLVLVEHPRNFKSGATNVGWKLFRDSTEIYSLRYLFDTNDSTRQVIPLSFNLLDTPSSTSSLTFKTQFNNESATGSVVVQKDGSTGKSTITLIEVAG
jgi:hypothetical protein